MPDTSLKPFSDLNKPPGIFILRYRQESDLNENQAAGQGKTPLTLLGELKLKLASADGNSGSQNLFRKGKPAVYRKLTEEAAEVWMAWRFESGEDLALEISQLWYYLILLSFYSPEDNTEAEGLFRKLESGLLEEADSEQPAKSLIHACSDLVCGAKAFPAALSEILRHSLKLAGSKRIQLTDIFSHL